MRKALGLSVIVIGLAAIAARADSSDLFKLPPKVEVIPWQAPRVQPRLAQPPDYLVDKKLLDLFRQPVPGGWIPKEFNGIRFYIVPVDDQAANPLTLR